MNRFYQFGFFILLSLIVTITIIFLVSNNRKMESIDLREAKIESVTDESSELKELFDSTLSRLDSVTSANYELMAEIRKSNPNAFIVKELTDSQKRMIRLIDSTNLLRDSINIVGREIVRLLSTPQLEVDQANKLKTTFAILGNISLSLNFALDNQRLGMLREDAGSLKNIVGSFDRRIERLNKFSRLLDKFSKYLQVAIDVFAAAVSQGFIVSGGVSIPGR
jgi:hypothetical protein